MRIPLHIGYEWRKKADFVKLTELHVFMASLNPKGFRQFSTKKKKQHAKRPIAEFYAEMAGMYDGDTA